MTGQDRMVSKERCLFEIKLADVLIELAGEVTMPPAGAQVCYERIGMGLEDIYDFVADLPEMQDTELSLNRFDRLSTDE